MPFETDTQSKHSVHLARSSRESRILLIFFFRNRSERGGSASSDMFRLHEWTPAVMERKMSLRSAQTHWSTGVNIRQSETALASWRGICSAIQVASRCSFLYQARRSRFCTFSAICETTGDVDGETKMEEIRPYDMASHIMHVMRSKSIRKTVFAVKYLKAT